MGSSVSRVFTAFKVMSLLSLVPRQLSLKVLSQSDIGLFVSLQWLFAVGCVLIKCRLVVAGFKVLFYILSIFSIDFHILSLVSDVSSWVFCLFVFIAHSELKLKLPLRVAELDRDSLDFLSDNNEVVLVVPAVCKGGSVCLIVIFVAFRLQGASSVSANSASGLIRSKAIVKVVLCFFESVG